MLWISSRILLLFSCYSPTCSLHLETLPHLFTSTFNGFHRVTQILAGFEHVPFFIFQHLIRWRLVGNQTNKSYSIFFSINLFTNNPSQGANPFQSRETPESAQRTNQIISCEESHSIVIRVCVVGHSQWVFCSMSEISWKISRKSLTSISNKHTSVEQKKLLKLTFSLGSHHEIAAAGGAVVCLSKEEFFLVCAFGRFSSLSHSDWGEFIQ